MSEEKDEKGWGSKIMGIIYYLLGIVKAWFTSQERKAEQNEREEIIKNETAKKTAENRNEAERLMEELKNAKSEVAREKILNEIRKKTSK